MPDLRSRVARLYWRLGGALRDAARLPGHLHAALYIALRLNRLYHRVGLPVAAQWRLMPAELWVSRRLMQQPYRVRLADIRWGGRPAGGEGRVGSGRGRGLVFAGDWDLEDRQPLDKYLRSYVYSRTVFQLFEERLAPWQTQQHAEMSDAVARGDFADWRTRGCRSLADVERHFDELRAIYDAISAGGYASQEELGTGRWHDEVKVFIGRAGSLHKLQGAGHHRLAMALIAGVQEIPVLVIGVHLDWALEAQREYGLDLLTSVDRRIRDTIASQPVSGAQKAEAELA